jgi:hypothetical protein
MDTGKVREYLDPIVRIQAVQDFSPSEALSFIPFLKGIIKEELKGENQGTRVVEELMELETRIDRLTLLAFDLYMNCREKIYEIRLGELRNRSVGVMERMQRNEVRRGGAPDLPRVTGDSEE